MRSLVLAAAVLLAAVAGAMGQLNARARPVSLPPIDILPPGDRGYWSSWSSWSSCSRTCGGGTRSRTRFCLVRIPLRPDGPILRPALPSATLSRRALRAVIRPFPFCFEGQRDRQTRRCNTRPCSGSGSGGDIITRPTNCKCPAQNRPGTPMVTCSCARLDVGAVVDGSGSISPSEFEDMRESLRALIADLSVSPLGDHVSLVLYSTQVRAAFPLTGSPSTLDDRVGNLTRPGRLTWTDRGITRMRQLILPGRDNVPKIGVVFTDGRSTDKGATLEAAADAKSRGITMFAVGIGDNLDQDELDAIASSTSTIFRATNFNDLRTSVVGQLAASINRFGTS